MAVKKAAAIKYEQKDEAPSLVAKGVGLSAEKILEEAKTHDIPIYEDKELAETLNRLELGDYIPEELYQVVAEILVFVTDLDRLHDKIGGI